MKTFVMSLAGKVQAVGMQAPDGHVLLLHKIGDLLAYTPATWKVALDGTTAMGATIEWRDES
jgi:hypothetical protein